MTTHDASRRHSDEGRLSAPERELLRMAAAGMLLDLQVGDAELDDPARGSSWEADRTIRADVLVEVLIGERTPTAGRPRSVKLRGARITGVLDLEAAELACPLLLADCHIEQPINLNEVTLRPYACSAATCQAAPRSNCLQTATWT